MTRAEINNPLCWDWVGVQQDNNPRADAPCYNPQDFDLWIKNKRNPKGLDRPLNPEHYINPLTIRESTGPLDFT